MQDYLVWTIAGFALVIIELMTGTFYLLVLGLGAFAGAIVAWLGGALLAQVVVAGIVALAGTGWVYRWHQTNRKAQGAFSNSLDVGQMANFEEWVNKPSGLARVKYRGSTWDALVVSGEPSAIHHALYIVGQEGQTLRVSTTQP
jgi:membrane protein implicated in regulation of membrane protease activity